MKKLLALILSILTVFSLTACVVSGENTDSSNIDSSAVEDENPFWYEDGCLKILIIGNSFSIDTMEYIGQIAKSYDKNVYLGTLYIGGCDINKHYYNYTNDKSAYDYYVSEGESWVHNSKYKSSDAVKATNWDFISFQQRSTWAGKWATHSSLIPFLEAVKDDVPAETKFVWNMTWAYQQDYYHDDFAMYSNSQALMYQEITKTVSNNISTLSLIDVVAPTGTAIQNARTSYLGDTLTRDGYHLDLTHGRYIAGLTFFCAITGLNAEKVGFFPEGMPLQGKLADVCLESTVNAINNPYAVTRSKIV